ncbi:hypothetical protein [Olivibacter ginsenosidimutans]|uniref:hypothetical protein n=1 Tax=Olivibacter ginsenosidimutans TaxID=1176537 RepID=UPI0031E601AE
MKALYPALIKSPKYARREALDYIVDLFEEQTSTALANNDHYVYEGHFSNDRTWDKPKAFKAAGYQYISFSLVWIIRSYPNLELQKG